MQSSLPPEDSVWQRVGETISLNFWANRVALRKKRSRPITESHLEIGRLGWYPQSCRSPGGHNMLGGENKYQCKSFSGCLFSS